MTIRNNYSEGRPSKKIKWSRLILMRKSPEHDYIVKEFHRKKIWGYLKATCISSKPLANWIVKGSFRMIKLRDKSKI